LPGGDQQERAHDREHDGARQDAGAADVADERRAGARVEVALEAGLERAHGERDGDADNDEADGGDEPAAERLAHQRRRPVLRAIAPATWRGDHARQRQAAGERGKRQVGEPPLATYPARRTRALPSPPWRSGSRMPMSSRRRA
jgi:hypothetical protein